MVTGRKAFEGRDAIDILNKIIREPVPSVSGFRPDAPNHLQRIVRRCLAKDPEERYQTIKDVAIELKELRREFTATTAGINSTVSPTAVGSTRRSTTIAEPVSLTTTESSSSAEYIINEIKRHRLTAAVAFVVLVLGAVGLYFYLHTRSTEVAIDSIAVLPFVNESSNPDVEYLSDGMTESLINSLSQLPNLLVKARSSVFRYKGKEVEPQQVGSELNVQAILSGRVVQRGDDLTLYLSLVDGRNGNQLWGEQYNRKLSDALAIQKEIAQTVSEHLRPRLSGAQAQQLAKGGTSSPQAYELLLRGKYLSEKSGTQLQIKANDFYRQAIQADPNYALAYAQLAISYGVLASNGNIDPENALTLAEAAARKAVELDETLSEGHLALGSVFRKQWKWADAEHELTRAVELNPNLGAAHRAHARHLSVMGRHDEAVAEASRARELDPLSVTVNVYVSYAYLFARRFDEGIVAARKTLELDPNSDFAYLMLAYNCAGKGQYREAIESYKKAVEFGDASTGTQIYLGAAYALAGERKKAFEILQQVRSSKEYVSPGELSVLLGALGLKDEAFASLEKAFAVRDLQLATITGDPAFDPLRNDPRFADLVRRVGFPI